MPSQPTKSQLEKELSALREEITELRAVESMHKQAQEGLQAIELQLAAIIHSAMDAIITVDEGQHIVLFNAAAEKMFCCSAKEVIGQSIDRFIPQRHRQAHAEHINTFGQTSVTNRRMGALGAISGLRANGEEFPLEASISHIKTGGKHLFTVILRDITERKRAEERISRLGRVLDDSLNEIYLFDADTLRFTQVNRGAQENLGYSMDELRTMTPLDLKPEFTTQSFQRLLHPLRTGEDKTVEFHTVHRRKDGTQYPVEVYLQLIQHDTSRIFVAIILDLTDRMKAEQALQESQRTLSTLISNLPGMVYRCKNDPEWTIEFVSAGCRGLTGYAPEDFIENRKVSYGRDLIAKEDQERVWNEVQVANREQKPFQLSYTLNTADGSKKWVWEQGCGVRSPEGEVVALEGYIFDVTQVKNLEEQLRKTERLAELGTLASGMAHEIGTPMNVILGRAELLMRKTTDETAKHGLRTIVTQVERITKIMDQLLSFARKRPMERRPLDLSVVIKDMLEVVQERLKKNNIQTQINITPPVPDVCADPDQMSQVLLNLILNACQAMPEGGTLRIGLKSEKSNVELAIADSGDGIPRENLSRVFDPFFTTKAAGEGTGLGLTVVHGIIQEHDGSITVDSEPGKGATFHIFLPIYQPAS